MSKLEYNGQVLTKARRELKLKADDVATELCLSVQQVQAIENNLNAFFNSNEIRQTVIKHYCRFLNIDVNSVITQHELDETDTNFQEIKRNNLGERLKKYVCLSIAAFIATLVWKLFE